MTMRHTHTQRIAENRLQSDIQCHTMPSSFRSLSMCVRIVVILLQQSSLCSVLYSSYLYLFSRVCVSYTALNCIEWVYLVHHHWHCKWQNYRMNNVANSNRNSNSNNIIVNVDGCPIQAVSCSTKLEYLYWIWFQFSTHNIEDAHTLCLIYELTHLRPYIWHTTTTVAAARAIHENPLS